MYGHCNWDPVGLVFRVKWSDDLEVLFDPLILSLQESISLRVEGHWKILLDVKFLCQGWSEAWCKTRVLVWDDLFWQPEPFVDVVQISYAEGFSSSPKLAAIVRAFWLDSVFVNCSNSIQIKVMFLHYQGKAEEVALLDTGATENFIDHTTVVKLHLGMKKLPYPCHASNVDGTLNWHGTITHACDLLVTKGNKKKWQQFFVTNLGWDQLLFGYPWFRTFKPDIDWENGTLLGPKVQMETLVFGTLQHAKTWVKNKVPINEDLILETWMLHPAPNLQVVQATHTIGPNLAAPLTTCSTMRSLVSIAKHSVLYCKLKILATEDISNTLTQEGQILNPLGDVRYAPTCPSVWHYTGYFPCTGSHPTAFNRRPFSHLCPTASETSNWSCCNPWPHHYQPLHLHPPIWEVLCKHHMRFQLCARVPCSGLQLQPDYGQNEATVFRPNDCYLAHMQWHISTWRIGRCGFAVMLCHILFNSLPCSLT